MFVDGPEFFLVLAQLDTEGNILTGILLVLAQLDIEGNILTKLKKTTSGLGGDAIARNV